ncbi:MAG: hypothetical protein QM785_05080 [Pyrinomonadaceae bacterium]
MKRTCQNFDRLQGQKPHLINYRQPMNKLIFFELNEVPVRILDYYRHARRNSWLAKNYLNLKKYETYSENIGHLSPWNTWPTVHRGVSNERHYISDFNQDLIEVDREFPPIWDILTKNGVKTGVFGSFHSYPLPSELTNYDFYVPDVFAAGSECFPASIDIFQDVNLKLSRESARNVDRSVPFGQIARLVSKITDLGFRPSTMLDIGGHLAQERVAPWKATRRRTYQSVLAFDVFYKLLRSRKPDFVTFFTNHVASSMHRYWAALFPDDYENQKYEQDWIETYGGEIVFAMDKTDKMLARLGAFVDANPEYKLIVTSSMGQNAIECEPFETQLYVDDKVKFMAVLGVEAGDFEPLPSMLPQFNFAISESRNAEVENKLTSLAVNGEPIVFRHLAGKGFSVDLGHQNLKETTISLGGRSIDLDESGLKNVVIEDKSSSTAYHIPEGHLFIYHPSFAASAVANEQMPTAEIASLILHNFGVERPNYMTSSIAGSI